MTQTKCHAERSGQERSDLPRGQSIPALGISDQKQSLFKS